MTRRNRERRLDALEDALTSGTEAGAPRGRVSGATRDAVARRRERVVPVGGRVAPHLPARAFEHPSGRRTTCVVSRRRG